MNGVLAQHGEVRTHQSITPLKSYLPLREQGNNRQREKYRYDTLSIFVLESSAEAADGAGAGMGGQDDDMVHSAKMGGALKILERMVNQNAEDEIFQDFKYWEVS